MSRKKIYVPTLFKTTRRTVNAQGESGVPPPANAPRNITEVLAWCERTAARKPSTRWDARILKQVSVLRVYMEEGNALNVAYRAYMLGELMGMAHADNLNEAARRDKAKQKGSARGGSKSKRQSEIEDAARCAHKALGEGASAAKGFNWLVKHAPTPVLGGHILYVGTTKKIVFESHDKKRGRGIAKSSFKRYW